MDFVRVQRCYQHGVREEAGLAEEQQNHGNSMQQDKHEHIESSLVERTMWERGEEKGCQRASQRYAFHAPYAWGRMWEKSVEIVQVHGERKLVLEGLAVAVVVDGEGDFGKYQKSEDQAAARSLGENQMMRAFVCLLERP